MRFCLRWLSSPGGNTKTLVPAIGDVIVGVPPQETGTRPAHALPYALNVHATVNFSANTITLTFTNAGTKTVVFQVRSANPADLVRTYTVEPGKQLMDWWNVVGSYHLSVYGPNGFIRYFNGSIASSAAILDVSSSYSAGPRIAWQITNLASQAQVKVKVLDAYTGNSTSLVLQPNQSSSNSMILTQFHGCYDLIVTVDGDPTFSYRLAGHVENGSDSISDPALGGLVTLKG